MTAYEIARDEISQTSIDAKLLEINSAFDARIAHETSKKSAPEFIAKLEGARKDLLRDARGVALLVQFDINLSFLNEVQRGTEKKSDSNQKFCEKALDRFVQTLAHIASNKVTRINHCVTFMLANAELLANKGLEFTTDMQTATCCHVAVMKRPVPGFKRITSISTANVGNRQATITRGALKALGIARSDKNADKHEYLEVDFSHPFVKFLLG